MIKIGKRWINTGEGAITYAELTTNADGQSCLAVHFAGGDFIRLYGEESVAMQFWLNDYSIDLLDNTAPADAKAPKSSIHTEGDGTYPY